MNGKLLALNKNSRKLLKELYKELENEHHITISFPKYEKIQVDMLIQNNLLGFIDAAL